MVEIIGVCGSGTIPEKDENGLYTIAEQVGKEIAQQNAVLLCGGKGGVMEAACKGAKQCHGLTIGILPHKKEEKNPYVDIPIVAGIGEKRNAMIIETADCIIALAGRWGTLNELILAGIHQTPIVFLKHTGGFVDIFLQSDFIKTFPSDYVITTDPVDAVTHAITLANTSHPKL